MASHTILEVQTKLNSLGYNPGPLDGSAGTLTDGAVVKFQADKGLPATGTLDPVTLNALFPSAISNTPKTIQATIADYVLNFVKSKTVYAAGALVAAIALWVNTKFGLTLPQGVQDTVTQLLVYGAMALVGVFQTFFNSPHMTTKQPAVVQQPSETK